MSAWKRIKRFFGKKQEDNKEDTAIATNTKEGISDNSYKNKDGTYVSVVVVPLPHGPIAMEHMMEWKLFASKVISLEAKRSHLLFDHYVDELTTVLQKSIDVDFATVKSNISPESYDFIPSLFIRIVPNLLKWRNNLIAERDRQESMKVSKGLSTSMLHDLAERLKEDERKERERKNEETIYKLTHTKEEYDLWMHEYHQQKFNEYINSDQYKRIKQQYSGM